MYGIMVARDLREGINHGLRDCCLCLRRHSDFEIFEKIFNIASHSAALAGDGNTFYGKFKAWRAT